MRPSKSRSRGKSRSNNRPAANNINRVFDSSGPEGKVRGTPQQIIDKYGQLARDASLGNDQVAAENFQQHAEHYTRLLAEAQRDAEEKRQHAEQQNRDRQQQQRPRDERSRSDAPAAPVEDFGSRDQPDLISDVSPSDETDSGLVETPEMKPRRKPAPRSRKPKPKPEAENGEAAPADASGSTEAAE